MSEAVTVGVGSEKVFLKFRKFHRKALVLESLFNRVAGLLACCVNIAVFFFAFSCFHIIDSKSYKFPRMFFHFFHVFTSFLCIFLLKRFV